MTREDSRLVTAVLNGNRQLMQMAEAKLGLIIASYETYERTGRGGPLSGAQALSELKQLRRRFANALAALDEVLS